MKKKTYLNRSHFHWWLAL